MATPDVVDGFFVVHKAAVGGRSSVVCVVGQDGVVWLDNRRCDVRSRVDTELKLALLAIVDRQTLHQQGERGLDGCERDAVSPPPFFNPISTASCFEVLSRPKIWAHPHPYTPPFLFRLSLTTNGGGICTCCCLSCSLTLITRRSSALSPLSPLIGPTLAVSL